MGERMTNFRVQGCSRCCFLFHEWSLTMHCLIVDAIIGNHPLRMDNAMSALVKRSTVTVERIEKFS